MQLQYLSSHILTNNTSGYHPLCVEIIWTSVTVVRMTPAELSQLKFVHLLIDNPLMEVWLTFSKNSIEDGYFFLHVDMKGAFISGLCGRKQPIDIILYCVLSIFGSKLHLLQNLFFFVISVWIFQQASLQLSGKLNQYILCDETSSSSINDSKYDVAPKWVDVPFTTSVHWNETIMAAFAWMAMKKQRHA